MHPKAKPTWKVNIDQVWEFQLYGPSKEVLGNNQWIFICRTDAEAETPILRPLDVKNWLIGKDPDAGKDQGQEEKGTTEDEMISPTQWTWVWKSSGRWWRTWKPGMLQSIGFKIVGHVWTTGEKKKPDSKFILKCNIASITKNFSGSEKMEYLYHLTLKLLWK